MPKDAVLITGCSAGGLGHGLALAFHEKNIHVFATARSLSKLSHLSQLRNITCLELDVTSSASIAKAVEAVKARLEEDGSRLRYLVNNAGRGLIGPVLDIDEEEARQVFETNFWGMISVTKAFVSLMLAGEGERHGKAVVVNVGSSAGVINVPWNGISTTSLSGPCSLNTTSADVHPGIYAASKAATNILSETLRLELEPLGISTITVVAGIIKTNFFSSISSYVLPPTSLYRSLEPYISKVAKGEDTAEMKGVMGCEEFGRLVVSDVLGGRRGKTYTGTLGWAAKWIVCVPGWVLVSSLRSVMVRRVEDTCLRVWVT